MKQASFITDMLCFSAMLASALMMYLVSVRYPGEGKGCPNRTKMFDRRHQWCWTRQNNGEICEICKNCNSLKKDKIAS